MAGTLIARDLHKAHGAGTSLAGVSVTVAPGDVLGVVGPNGAGKSTLLRLLARIDRPDAGTVQLTAGPPRPPRRGPGRGAGEAPRPLPGAPPGGAPRRRGGAGGRRRHGERRAGGG